MNLSLVIHVVRSSSLEGSSVEGTAFSQPSKGYNGSATGRKRITCRLFPITPTSQFSVLSIHFEANSFLKEKARSLSSEE